MGTVIAVCISKEKGTQKIPVESIKLIPDWGIENDAHAGHWHRQVSLLGLEKIEDFRARGAEVDFGAFGENIIIEGFDLRALPVGTRFTIGGCAVRADTDWQGVPYTLRDLSSGWRLYHAQRRGIYPGIKGRKGPGGGYGDDDPA